MNTIKNRILLAFLVSIAALPAFGANVPDNLLRSSLDLLSRTKGIRVHAVVMTDDVAASGQKLQRNSEIAISVRRPDGLRIESTGDRSSRSIRYDGKVLVVYDPGTKFYATFAAPASIDATMAAAREKLALDLPLGHLFAENAYEKMQARRSSETYVALHRVEGVPCHHLAYTQENVDWQIWIAAEGPPLPRKIVIDFKNRPGRPQYIAILSDWNLDARFDAGEFQFTAPAGAQKIEFLPVQGGTK